jgi:hypothetical protein
VALEQGDADAIFEKFHLQSDGRLGHVKFFRRGREAARMGHGHEIADLSKRTGCHDTL